MKRLSTILLFLPMFVMAQWPEKISVHVGPTYSYQSQINQKPGGKIGWGFGLETNVLKLGESKKTGIDLNLSFLQKGGYNIGNVFLYNQFGQLLAVGEESYPVTVNYLSIAPLLKVDLSDHFYFKFGPRMDYFLGFKPQNEHAWDTRSNDDFERLTHGISYAVGVNFGNKGIIGFFEIQGQHDYTSSTLDPISFVEMYNNAVWLNTGFRFNVESSSRSEIEAYGG